MPRGAVALALALLVAVPSAHPQAPTASDPLAYSWQLPPGFPPPPVPADNPMSAAKVALGRHLFHDPRLSGNRTQSCATCHQPARAFTDGRARARGSTGVLHPRGAQTLANAGYRTPLTWRNDGPESLEAQLRIPLLGAHPVEMGMHAREAELLARLAAVRRYRELFRAAFPGEPDPLTVSNLARAIAAFERTLLSGRSAYDRLLFDDDQQALSPEAWRGMELFHRPRLGCSRCHGGLDLSGSAPPPAVPATTPALRTPSLRNLTVTAPYMHDGSLPTLDAVLDHYASAGRSGGPRRDPPLPGFALDPGERAAVLAFLAALTDDEFLRDPRFGDPWRSATRSPLPAPAH